MVSSTGRGLRSKKPGDLTSGDCALPLSLTKLLGCFDWALFCVASPLPTLPFRSLDGPVSYAADFGRVPPPVLPACLGEALALPGLDARAEERGVILPLARTSLIGVVGCFALGVGGSDLIVGVGREPVDFVGGVALPATRGVTGVRAVRVDARDGFNGRLGLVDRSEDMRPILLSSPLHLSTLTHRSAPQAKFAVQSIPTAPARLFVDTCNYCAPVCCRELLMLDLATRDPTQPKPYPNLDLAAFPQSPASGPAEFARGLPYRGPK